MILHGAWVDRCYTCRVAAADRAEVGKGEWTRISTQSGRNDLHTSLRHLIPTNRKLDGLKFRTTAATTNTWNKCPAAEGSEGYEERMLSHMTSHMCITRCP